ncbi:MAG: 4-hydroxy-tetrahydrodipicolinate synthase [Acidimicrobiales bacterium]
MIGGPGRFGAVMTAMVTPFDEDGALDLDGAAQLARWLVQDGNDGLVIAGTTGEGSVLTDAEKADLWRAVSEAVTVPVIANVGSNDTAHSVAMARVAAATGAAGVLVVTPYYNRPSQAGILAHFAAVATAAGGLPVMIYDIPVRTGRRVALETMVTLAGRCPNVIAVKDAAGDPSGSARLATQMPSGFDLYCGDSSLTLPLLAVGASGVIGVASHWSGFEHGEMLAAYWSGDVSRARQINARLLDSFDFEGSEAWPNPVPAKAVMRALGLPSGQCRLPMGPASAELDDRARQIVTDLGRLEPAQVGVSRSPSPARSCS